MQLHHHGGGRKSEKNLVTVIARCQIISTEKCQQSRVELLLLFSEQGIVYTDIVA